MDTHAQSEIFFLISSVGFVILWVLVAICLVYIIRSMHAISRVIDKAEKEVDVLSDTTKEMIEDIKQSTIFHFLFKKKKSKSPRIK